MSLNEFDFSKIFGGFDDKKNINNYKCTEIKEESPQFAPINVDDEVETATFDEVFPLEKEHENEEQETQESIREEQTNIEKTAESTVGGIKNQKEFSNIIEEINASSAMVNEVNNKKTEKVEKTVDVARQKTEDLEENKKLIAAIQHRNELIELYENEIEKMKSEMSELTSKFTKEKEELQSQLTDKDLQLNEFFVEINKLKEQLVQEEQTAIQMNDDLDSAHDEIKKAEEKNNELNDTIESLTSQVENLKEELSTCKENHQLLKAKYQASTEMLRSEELAHEQSKATVDHLRNEVTKLYDRLIEEISNG